MIETILYTAALAVVALTCLLGVFSNKFNDNLLQRIGMSMACVGAAVRITEYLDKFPDETLARYLLTHGVALFCLGTIWKFWRKK